MQKSGKRCEIALYAKLGQTQPLKTNEVRADQSADLLGYLCHAVEKMRTLLFKLGSDFKGPPVPAFSLYHPSPLPPSHYRS